METGFPAIENMPVCDTVDGGATEKLSVAGPVPFVPDKAVIQLTEFETFQFTPCGIERLKDTVPPLDEML